MKTQGGQIDFQQSAYEEGEGAAAWPPFYTQALVGPVGRLICDIKYGKQRNGVVVDCVG